MASLWEQISENVGVDHGGLSGGMIHDKLVLWGCGYMIGVISNPDFQTNYKVGQNLQAETRENPLVCYINMNRHQHLSTFVFFFRSS